MISGLGGSIMSCLTDSRGERVSVGASGALFGLLGALLSELITNWTIYENKVKALSSSTFMVYIIESWSFFIAVYITYDINPDHCTEPKRRILTTCRQFCSLWRILSRFFPRFCPSSPSAVRIREPQVYSTWLWRETQEIKTQVLSTCLQVYIFSHSPCGVSSPKTQWIIPS